MSLETEDIIKVASDAYPDGLIEQAAADEEFTGDGLAKFIAHELMETSAAMSFMGGLKDGIEAIRKAEFELIGVREALERTRQQCMRVDAFARRNELDLPLLIGEITDPVAQKYLEHRIKEAKHGRS